MATEEDLKKAEAEDGSAEAADEPAEDADAADAELRSSADDEAERSNPERKAKAANEAAEAGEELDVPVQLGHQRYVYAAYMAGALLVAFLAAKIGYTVWYRLGQWKPEIGEPKDEILYVVAVVIGIAVALYYWRKPDSRQYADEVAEELSKVTWPSRKEVTNSTTVVVLTTLFATVFFALMDRFWGFITDKIYTF